MSGSLSHSPADIIRELLIDKSVGTDPDAAGDWPVYALNEPNTPDSLITIFNSASVLEGRDQNAGEMNEHFGIQIRIRAADPNDGWRKANAIKTSITTDVLRTIVSIADTTGTATSQYRVQAITLIGGILDLGKVEGGTRTKRNILTINAIAAILETV